jgi:alpha-L-fucosidase
MGKWVKTNSEAIFGTKRWTTFSEGVTNGKRDLSLPTEFWFSAKDDTVYAMSLVPGTGRVRILSLNESAGKVTQVRLLGGNQPLQWTQTDAALEIDFDGIATGPNGYAVGVTLK